MKNEDISTREAAQILNCAERTIRNMIKRGSLVNVRKLDPNSKSVYILSRKEIESLLYPKAKNAVQKTRTR